MNKREKERVKLGLCASVLALSSIDGWVSCYEEVPTCRSSRAHYNLVDGNKFL